MIGNIKTADDFDPIWENIGIDKSEVILIKPNWVGLFDGGYTDTKVIDLLLTSLKGKKVVFLESYSFWRTDKKISGKEDYFSSKEATLETGIKHWDFFKKMDQWFLDTSGIGDVLKKHGASYMSITDELWKDGCVDPKTISTLVESKYSPVMISDMYEIIPKSLFQFKDAPLISFAKAKIDGSYGASFSIKNLFGLIPDPDRYEKYHGGDKEDKLVSSIIDINKIYKSIFDVKYVVESVFNYCEMNWDTGKSKLLNKDGLIAAGNDGYEVDSEAMKLFETELKGPIASLLDEYKKVFKS